jgi:hypothetical protein
MDPNRGAAALYESNAGGQRPGSRVMRWIALFGAPKWHPSKNREMDGAPILGGRYSMGRRNNLPNNRFGGGWAFERRWDWAERVGEDVYSSFWAAN